MYQPIKFKYDRQHIVFFVIYKGAAVEVLRAVATLELEQVKALSREAQFQANELLSLLKAAA